MSIKKAPKIKVYVYLKGFSCLRLINKDKARKEENGLKHRYSIVLADGSVLTFKSKNWIGSMYITVIDNEPMLCFPDAHVKINTNKIIKITVDEKEFKIGYYAH